MVSSGSEGGEEEEIWPHLRQENTEGAVTSLSILNVMTPLTLNGAIFVFPEV